MRAREMRMTHASTLVEIHKNSVYRMLIGEDVRISTYQKVARALGLRLEVADSEWVQSVPVSARVRCPACGDYSTLPPAHDSGRFTCPKCNSRLRIKKVVRYVARRAKEALGEPDDAQDDSA